MPELDEGLERATAEANDIFEKLRAVVEERVGRRETSIDVIEVAREAGLEIDDGVLKEIQIPQLVPVHPFIPWYLWFPWRPLWCWWWHFRYPWYRCCPYWWYRCHWYPS